MRAGFQTRLHASAVEGSPVRRTLASAFLAAVDFSPVWLSPRMPRLMWWSRTKPRAPCSTWLLTPERHSAWDTGWNSNQCFPGSPVPFDLKERPTLSAVSLAPPLGLAYGGCFVELVE